MTAKPPPVYVANKKEKGGERLILSRVRRETGVNKYRVKDCVYRRGLRKGLSAFEISLGVIPLLNYLIKFLNGTTVGIYNEIRR